MQLLSLLVFAIVCVACIYCNQAFLARDCGGDSAILSLNSVSITPDPVAIPGAVRVNLDVSAKTDVSKRAWDLDVTIQRYVGFLWVTVPCISEVGSCKYDACQLLDGFKTTGCPPEMVANNIPCTCETITAGQYTLNDQRFSIPELTGLWSWLASGDYKVDATLTDRTTNTKVGCLHAQVTVVDANACEGFLCSIFG